MVLVSDNNYIAPGYYEQETMKRWHHLSDGLFESYRNYIDTEWKNQEGFTVGGDRVPVAYGKPSVVYKFPRLTYEEYAYIIGYLFGPVTIRVQNKAENRWANYNGILVIPEEVTDESGEYRDVNIEVRDLYELVESG